MFFVISVAWAGVARPCSWRCRCWHLADVDGAADQCPFTGVKQTSQFDGAMSAFDPKQTSRAFLGFRFLSERAAQWLDLRTGSALLAQQPREFGRRGSPPLRTKPTFWRWPTRLPLKSKIFPSRIVAIFCLVGVVGKGASRIASAHGSEPPSAGTRASRGLRQSPMLRRSSPFGTPGRPGGRALWFYPTTEVRAVLSELSTSPT